MIGSATRSLRRRASARNLSLISLVTPVTIILKRASARNLTPISSFTLMINTHRSRRRSTRKSSIRRISYFMWESFIVLLVLSFAITAASQVISSTSSRYVNFLMI
ncbi:hypothetical protein EDD22DRAFT_969752 [Suillus occidentalis]|nr:hypothetical protein EDD22DRAFT_969752 [Suillus occidentalis]